MVFFYFINIIHFGVYFQGFDPYFKAQRSYLTQFETGFNLNS